jgi:hypothetical protein
MRRRKRPAAYPTEERRKMLGVRSGEYIGDYLRPNFNGGRSAEDGEQGSKRKEERERG